MDVLTQVPLEFHKLSFHLWNTDEAVVDSIIDYQFCQGTVMAPTFNIYW